jgi:beta-galactosidase
MNKGICRAASSAFFALLLVAAATVLIAGGYGCARPQIDQRTRVLINDGWRFKRGDPPHEATSLLYDDRPNATAQTVVKSWILPSGNDFVDEPAKLAKRPAGNLGGDVAYVAVSYDDASWQQVSLPHDYAIGGPYTPMTVSGNMARLPSPGVVWYRKALDLSSSDSGGSVFLDIDGAMSYSEVWLNGQFVGGWPYGYASFRLNLTPYVKFGGSNVLAIRLDNPVPADAQYQSGSSRWYPGGGLYRNVWLVETAPVHVGQWGTYVTTPEVSAAAATVDLKVTVDNDSAQEASVSVATAIFEIDAEDNELGPPVASIAPAKLQIPAGKSAATESSGVIPTPKLWGAGLGQTPNRYVAVTTVQQGGKSIDTYETPFGVRTLKFDPDAGFFLNGEHVKLNGVCSHHDLGALGAALNYRALQRRLEMLAEMGANAIRTSHNPPAPELLDLADKMGFLVLDEAFDVWAEEKVDLDYHLLYPDWHEQDLRAMLRRDRNHPSVIMWGIGNEVGEQSDGSAGATIAAELTGICHEEDPTRPTVSAMNAASATSSFPAPIDAVGLNYQGSGVGTQPPQYPVFHQSFPDKFIVGTETVSTVSSRGVYTFPVASGLGEALAAVPTDGTLEFQVSSYDLYYPSFGSSPDKEFSSQDSYPFVGGEFVWAGVDYLGEPTPFDTVARSSYYGIIDLAGFPKDRFYLYQSVWLPEQPMAHILPHWTWPERVGQTTPVHVYTSGDAAELFLNGTSLGLQTKGPSDYRLRWDDVVYQPGELSVVAYKNRRVWAMDSVTTVGSASQLLLTPDRSTIAGDGTDLSFVTLTVADQDARTVPRSLNMIHFAVSGPGAIVATDNGDPTDQTVFPSTDRNAFNGLALAIVRAEPGQKGDIVVTATSDGLAAATATITAQ